MRAERADGVVDSTTPEAVGLSFAAGG